MPRECSGSTPRPRAEMARIHVAPLPTNPVTYLVLVVALVLQPRLCPLVVPRLVDLNVYGESYTPKRDNVCKLFVLGYDLCIIKYHVQCNLSLVKSQSAPLVGLGRAGEQVFTGT